MPAPTKNPATTPTTTKRHTSTTPVDNRSKTTSSSKKPGLDASNSKPTRQPTPKNTHAVNGTASPEHVVRDITFPSQRTTKSPKPVVDSAHIKSSPTPQPARNGVHSNSRNHVDDDDAEFAVIEESAPEPLRRPMAQPTKHVGQPTRMAAAPPPAIRPPLAAPNIPVAYENEDFETYDDDFEDEIVEDEIEASTSKAELPTSKSGETEVVSATETLQPASKPAPISDAVQQPIPAEPMVSRPVAVVDEANVAKLLSTLQRQPHYQSAHNESAAVIDFHSAQTQQSSAHAQRAAARRSAKFNTIRRLVQFEISQYRHCTLTPAGSHARYLELFGKQNVKLAASQTDDEHADEEIQTEVPESFNVWTQHPALSANQVSDRDDSSNRSFSAKNNSMLNSSTIVSFIAQASECMLKLLYETSSSTSANYRRNYTKNNVNAISLEGKSDVFANVSLLGPEAGQTSSIEYNDILCIACNEPKMDRIATCHARIPSQQNSSPTNNTEMTMILIWNISSPLTPEVALCTQDTNSRITCCTFHKLDQFVVIAGCGDGSLQCWSTRATTTPSSSPSSRSFLQFSTANSKFTTVPVLSAEFSTAPLGGGRWPPPHIAPVAALDEYVDINGGRRVGIADVSSSCTLASLDTCSTLCLWNVVTDSPRNHHNRQRKESASSKDNHAKSTRTQGARPSTASTTTTADLDEFCITPAALSSSNNSSYEGMGASGSAAAMSSHNVLRLVLLSTVNILDSTRMSRAENSSIRPSSAFTTTFSTLPISYNSANCLARFCPYFFSSNIGATTTVACLVDGRLYRVNNSSSRQLLGGYKTTAKVVDRTPRNVPVSSIVSFAFPPPTASFSSSSLSDINNSIVACLHDIGNVTFVSFDTGLLLASWSSPLISSMTNFNMHPTFPHSLSLDLQNLSFGQTAQSIWWPNNGVIIIVGSDAAVVKFDFSATDESENSSHNAFVLDGSIPQVNVDKSMTKTTTTQQQNAAGDSNRCVASFVGQTADANVTKLIMVTNSGPIAMLQIKSRG